jgi:hypothetical protein
VVVDSVVIPESVVVIDVASSPAVIDAEMNAGGDGLLLCSEVGVDEDEESASSAEEVAVAIVAESIVVSSAPTAVATSPARAGKIDKSLSAHATYTP